MGVWGRGSSGSDNSVGDDGGAIGKDAPSLLAICLALKMPKVEGEV